MKLYFLNNITNILICLYIFILPLSPDKFKVRGLTLGDITLTLIMLFYFFSLIIDKSTRKRFFIGIKDFLKDYLSRFIIVLMIMMFISITYAIEKKLALSESLRFVSYIVLFFIIKYEISKEDILKIILRCYIFVSSIIGALGIIQYLTKYELADVFNIKRITSTLDNPNNLGAFLILIIFPIIMLVILEKDKLHKAIYSFITLLILINIVLAGSRSSFIGFAVGCLILSIIYSRKMLLAIGGVGACSFFIPAIGNRIKDMNNLTQNISRIKLWELSARMIKEHPILGVGNGNFVSYYDKYARKYPELESGWHQRYPAHNSYLKVTSELGIIGIIAFLGIIISSTIKIKRFLSNVQDKFLKAFYLGFFASMIAFFVMNFTDNLFFVPKTTTFFWITLAICDSICFNKQVNKVV